MNQYSAFAKYLASQNGAESSRCFAAAMFVIRWDSIQCSHIYNLIPWALEAVSKAEAIGKAWVYLDGYFPESEWPERHVNVQEFDET